MDCSEYQKYVSKLIDYELGENSAEALKSHLAACSACRKYLRTHGGVEQVPDSQWII